MIGERWVCIVSFNIFFSCLNFRRVVGRSEGVLWEVLFVISRVGSRNGFEVRLGSWREYWLVFYFCYLE